MSTLSLKLSPPKDDADESNDDENEENQTTKEVKARKKAPRKEGQISFRLLT